MIAAYTIQFWRSRRVRGRPAVFYAALVVCLLVILVATPEAQQTPAFAPTRATLSPPIRDAVSGTEIDLLVGRSAVLNIGSTIARVSLTVPDIADALVTAPTQLLVHGKQPGTISLFVWDKAGSIKTYEVNVRRDLSALIEHLKQLFPGEDITVLGSGKDVVISGVVSGQYVIDKAADVAAGYVEKKDDVVNLLKQQEGVASNQVLLRVRFAEVSRSALTEMGASFFTGPGGFHDYVSRVTTQQFPANHFTEMVRASEQGPDNWGGGRDTVTATGGEHTFSDFLNLFIFNNRYNIGTVVRALSQKGLFQSLAEPNLIATNGKEASFLAGGEYPYPVIQAGAATSSVSISFKEFGIRLSFTPTVLGGDLINLRVRPEVSALDFSNAVTLQGFRVPALSTRRTETEVELRDGQTFAIAGLLNNTVTDSMRKIPGIGDIPILGWLFKSKAMAKNQTELVVMITPTIVRRGQMGVSEGLPSMTEPFLGRPDTSLPPPDPYVGSPRYPASRMPGSSDNHPPASGSPFAVAPASEGFAQPPGSPAGMPQEATPQSPEGMPAMPGLPPSQQPPATAPPESPAGSQPDPMTFAPQSGVPVALPPPPAGPPQLAPEAGPPSNPMGFPPLAAPGGTQPTEMPRPGASDGPGSTPMAYPAMPSGSGAASPASLPQPMGGPAGGTQPTEMPRPGASDGPASMPMAYPAMPSGSGAASPASLPQPMGGPAGGTQPTAMPPGGSDGPASMPMAYPAMPSGSGVASPAPPPQMPASAQPVAPLTAEQSNALKKARERERKAAEAEAKRRAAEEKRLGRR